MRLLYCELTRVHGSVCGHGGSGMPAEVTRDEFRVIEREVEGEKMVTRHILEQTRHNGDDLAAIKSRLDRIEMTVDRIDRRLDGVEQRVDGGEKRVAGLDSKVDGLIKTLPRIIGEAVREAFDERDRRKT